MVWRTQGSCSRIAFEMRSGWQKRARSGRGVRDRPHYPPQDDRPHDEQGEDRCEDQQDLAVLAQLGDAARVLTEELPATGGARCMKGALFESRLRIARRDWRRVGR